MSEPRKELGKIKSARFGFGGYDDVQFGLSVTLSTTGGEVQDFWGTWSPSQYKHSAHTQWSEKDRLDELLRTTTRVDKLLKDAKARDINELLDKPVEVTFDGNLLREWRILTEVL